MDEQQILNDLNIKRPTDADFYGLNKNRPNNLYRCQKTGLYFPEDYLDEWGRKYGIGLGRDPVSECLEVQWENKIAIPRNLQSIKQIMFPLGQNMATVEAVSVEYKEAVNNMAICMKMDPFLVRRADKLYEYQYRHRNGRLKGYLAAALNGDFQWGM